MPPELIVATTPPANITHLPAISNSGGVHSLAILPAIIFAAPNGVAPSTISFTSRVKPTTDITGPKIGALLTSPFEI